MALRNPGAHQFARLLIVEHFVRRFKLMRMHFSVVIVMVVMIMIRHRELR
jgi:hypothetical protein